MRTYRPVQQQSDVPAQQGRIRAPNIPGVQPDIAQFGPVRHAVNQAVALRRSQEQARVRGGYEQFGRHVGLGDADINAAQQTAPFFHTLPNKLRMVNFSVAVEQTPPGGIILINANPLRRRFIVQMLNAQAGAFYWTYGSTMIGSGFALTYWDENGAGISTDDIYIYNTTGSEQLVTAYEGVDHDQDVPQ